MFFTKRLFTIPDNIAGRIQHHQYEEHVFVGDGGCMKVLLLLDKTDTIVKRMSEGFKSFLSV